MFQLSACSGPPGQRHRMKLASGYKLISGRRGWWQNSLHRGGLPQSGLNGSHHTQSCLVQTTFNGRNTRKMILWRYAMLFYFFYSRGIFHIRRKAVATCYRQFLLILQNIKMLKHFVSVLLQFLSLYDCVIHLLIRIWILNKDFLSLSTKIGWKVKKLKVWL